MERCSGHENARRNRSQAVSTLGTTSLDVISAGRVPDRRSCQANLATRPAGPAALRGSLLASPVRCVGPFGQDEQYGPAHRGGNGLIHELGPGRQPFVHQSDGRVDGMWTTAGAECATRARIERPDRRRPGQVLENSVSRCRDALRSASPGPCGRSGRSTRTRSASRTRGRHCPGRRGSSRPRRRPSPGSAAPGTG